MIEAARDFLLDLQDRVCAALEEVDGGAAFDARELETRGGGLVRPRVLSDGALLERAAVNFSHTRGDALPAAATVRRPELADRPFEAVSVSLIVHPENPYVPTCHANFRAFAAGDAWWYGGGFDLTPYYGFEEDAVHWHRTARDACAPFGADVHPRLKAWCDEYFRLAHRDEPRGIGGLFFDDWTEGGPAAAAGLWRSVAEHFLPAYLPIVERRRGLPWGERERAFQLYRRGRYVEFNLIQDRGTRYGLQSGGRVESILASLPPLAAWRYDWRPEPGSPEAELTARFLVPRDWLAGETG